MPLSNALANLRAFGEELGLANLNFDENNTCILGIDNTFSLHLTYEHNSHRLYLYSPLRDGLPPDAETRLRLYEELLKGSMLGGQMAGGGVGVAVKEELILMHTVLSMSEDTDPTLLKKFAPYHVKATQDWRQRCADICGGSPYKDSEQNKGNAIKAATTAVGRSLTPEQAEKDFKEGIELAKKGLHKKACAAFKDSIECYENLGSKKLKMVPACNALGRALYRVGEYKEAIEVYKKALKIQAEDKAADPTIKAKTYYYLIIARERMGNEKDLSDAVKDSEVAIDLCEKNNLKELMANIYSAVSRVYFLLPRYNKATIIHFVKAVEVFRQLASNNESITNELLIARYHLTQVQELGFNKILAKALQKDEKLRDQQDKYIIEATKIREQFTADDKQRAETLLAQRYYTDGQWLLASGYYEKIIARDPKNVDAHCRLARCYQLLKQNNKARACYVRAIEQANCVQVQCEYAQFLYKEKDYDLAISSLLPVLDGSLQSDKSRLSFTALEGAILEESVHGDVFREGHLSIDPKAFAYHLTVKCYMKRQVVGEDPLVAILACANKFSSYVQAAKSLPEDMRLLGYAFQSMSSACFHKAAKDSAPKQSASTSAVVDSKQETLGSFYTGYDPQTIQRFAGLCYKFNANKMLRFVFQKTEQSLLLQQLNKFNQLKDLLGVSACFVLVSSEVVQLGSRHYVFFTVIGDNLLIVNPAAKLQDCPELLQLVCAIKNSLKIKTVFTSDTVLQSDKDEYSSGPLCVELMTHFSSLSKETIAETLSAVKSTIKTFTLQGDSKDSKGEVLNCHAVNIQNTLFVPQAIKELSLDRMQDYIDKMKAIRTRQLQMLNHNNTTGEQQQLIKQLIETNEAGEVTKTTAYKQLSAVLTLPDDLKNHFSTLGLWVNAKLNPTNVILEYCDLPVPVLAPRHNLKMPLMGLGCSAITSSNSAIVDHAIRNGITLFDTANCYLDGECERALGEMIKKHDRSKLTICTKVGVQFQGSDIHLCADQKQIETACDGSLARLKTHIDVYYLHRVDPKTPIEESVRALGALVHKGKVKHIGLSEVTADQIRRAHKVHPVSAVQIEYSPWSRQDESNGVINTCKELGITVVAYSPLGRAFFTQLDGNHFATLPSGDFRQMLPRYTGTDLQNNISARKNIQQLADQKGCTLAQFVLAWEIAKGLVPIPSTTHTGHFDENRSALNVKLSETEIATCDAIISSTNFTGPRYPNERISAIYPESSNVGTAANTATTTQLRY